MRGLLVACMLTTLALPTGASAAPPTVVLPTLPTIPEVDDARRAQAKAAWERALAALESGEDPFAHALEAFRLLPAASLANGIAELYLEAGRLEEAFAMLLVAADLKSAPALRQQVLASLAEVGARLTPPRGYLMLTAEPAEAVTTLATVEGTAGVEVVGSRTVGLSGGALRATIRAEGFVTATRELAIAPGAGLELKVELTPKPPAATTEPLVETADAQPKVDRGPAVASFIVGAAALAGAGVSHYLALDARDAAERLRLPGGGLEVETRRARYDEEQKAYALRRDLAYALYGVGGAALIVGTVLWATADGSSPAERVEVRPTLAPSSGQGLWVGATGAF